MLIPLLLRGCRKKFHVLPVGPVGHPKNERLPGKMQQTKGAYQSPDQHWRAIWDRILVAVVPGINAAPGKYPDMLVFPQNNLENAASNPP
jgi:hypothetical protein